HDIEATIDATPVGIRPGCVAAFPIEVEGQERLVVVVEIDGSRMSDDPDPILVAIRHAVSAEHDLSPFDVVLIPPGEIPKTSSGKIQRSLARQRYLEHDFTVVGRSLRPGRDDL